MMMAAAGPAPTSPTSSNGSLSSKKPTLDQLVDHFLAAKRSLSSIAHVWRAREIVDTGREALEANAALSAKNAFVKQAVDVQVESLHAIRLGASEIDVEGFEELQATVRALDEASARLNTTLDLLRHTLVEHAFRPAVEEPKCLFDFVDEAGVNELYDAIKQSMDRFDAARTSLLTTCDSFDGDLDSIQESLEAPPEETAEHGAMRFVGPSPVPSLFYSLESNATEIATHLEGLVKHYDLCVTALKHTEGGGEAISKASGTDGDDHESKLVGLGVEIARFDDNETAPPPLSDEDRADMLTVLMKDAGEVNDVVHEIRDRLAEMEDHLSQIHAYMLTVRAMSSRLHTALQLMKGITGNVPAYISGCAEFQTAWEEEKNVLRAKMEEVYGLTEFYEGFAAAYDGLIVEVHRRRNVKREMEKVIKHAMSQIEKLYKADLAHREDFKVDQGEHLPIDIWPGLMDPPIKYRISTLDEDREEIPELKTSVVEKALKRITDRTKVSLT